MKARVKATGEIVEVSEDSSYVNAQHFEKVYYLDELEWIDVKKDTDPDYWTRLEHQAAIAAMQGMCANPQYPDKSWDAMAGDATDAAHALIQKLKEKEERK